MGGVLEEEHLHKSRNWRKHAGGCSSGINVSMRQGAVCTTPASRRGRRSIILQRHGEASRCGGSRPQQIRHPRGRIWNPGKQVLLVVTWHCWPGSPAARSVFHQGWKRRHHRRLECRHHRHLVRRRVVGQVTGFVTLPCLPWGTPIEKYLAGRAVNDGVKISS